LVVTEEYPSIHWSKPSLHFDQLHSEKQIKSQLADMARVGFSFTRCERALPESQECKVIRSFGEMASPGGGEESSIIK
jgi:hypothetical protein